MSLADLEDQIEAVGRRKPLADLPHPWLANGFYTLTFPCGTHKTIRLHTQQTGPFGGKRLFSLLIGPDNTADYEKFAELTPAGVWVWRRFKNDRRAAYPELLILLAKGERIEGHELHVSKRCLRCNRVLSTPQSLDRGIGDECYKREHGKGGVK